MKHGQLNYNIENLRFKRYYDGEIEVWADLFLSDTCVFSGTLSQVQKYIEEILAQADITAPKTVVV